MTIPIDMLEQAACAGTDPEVFFPQHGAGKFDSIRTAVAICQSCPIRLACLEEALEFSELGIWGGTSDADRHRMTGRSRDQIARRPYKYGMTA